MPEPEGTVQTAEKPGPRSVPQCGARPDVFYRDILDNMTEGVYFVDTDRRITFWNPWR